MLDCFNMLKCLPESLLVFVSLHEVRSGMCFQHFFLLQFPGPLVVAGHLANVKVYFGKLQFCRLIHFAIWTLTSVSHLGLTLSAADDAKPPTDHGRRFLNSSNKWQQRTQPNSKSPKGRVESRDLACMPTRFYSRKDDEKKHSFRELDREAEEKPSVVFLTVKGQMAVVVKTNGIPFWGRCTTHLEPILVGIGMFTGVAGFRSMALCLVRGDMGNDCLLSMCQYDARHLFGNITEPEGRRATSPNGCGSKRCTPGEYPNRWQMDVHPPQHGAIGYDPWPNLFHRVTVDDALGAWR